MTDNITKCTPCGCISGTTQNETFKQNVQIILCEILTALGGGGTGPSFAHAEGSVAVGGDEGVPTLAQVTNAPTFVRAGLGKYDWLVIDNTTGSLLTRLVNSGFGNDPVKQGITGTAFVSGDALMLEGGIINEAAAHPTSTANAFVPFSVNRFGSQYVALDSALQVSAATGILKLQGGTVTAADAGVAVDAQATTSSVLAGPGNGKYGPLTIDNATGSLLSRLVNSGFANDPVKTGSTGSYSSGDAVFGAAGQVNEAASSISSTAAHYVPFAVNRFGSLYSSIDSGLQVSAATGLLKLTGNAGTSWTTLDAAPAIAGVAGNVADAIANFTSTASKYVPFHTSRGGELYVNINTGAMPSADIPTSILKRSVTDSWTSGDSGPAVLFYQETTPSTTGAGGADGKYSVGKVNSKGVLYSDGVLRSAGTETTPSVNSATSTTIVAANAARRYLLVQNNTGANIMISLTGNTLTGIVPTSTNKGIVLASGQTYENPPHWCPTGNITAYQTSGGTVNTIVCEEA